MPHMKWRENDETFVYKYTHYRYQAVNCVLLTDVVTKVSLVKFEQNILKGQIKYKIADRPGQNVLQVKFLHKYREFIIEKLKLILLFASSI